MRFTQIASEGGLLPAPIVRDSFQIWPAKRREVVVDFSRYMDGTPTTKGDVIYLTNILKMATGRKPNNEPKELNDDGVLVDDPEFDPNYAVPVLKIVIGDNAPDDSLVPKQLRALPPMPRSFKGVTARTFELQRSGKYGGEIEWLINDLPFEPSTSLAFPLRGSGELWTIRNGGGGWVHPLHLHMEEHRVISRNGVPTPAPGHPDDNSKEDVVALGPGEEVVIYRQFRTFAGKYVSHCHNLAHEDHAMMLLFQVQPNVIDNNQNP